MYSPASLEERGGGKNATTRRRPCFDILVVVRACGKVLDGEILRIPPRVRRAVEDLPRQYRRRSSTEAGRRLTSPISSRDDGYVVLLSSSWGILPSGGGKQMGRDHHRTKKPRNHDIDRRFDRGERTIVVRDEGLSLAEIREGGDTRGRRNDAVGGASFRAPPFEPTVISQ